MIQISIFCEQISHLSITFSGSHIPFIRTLLPQSQRMVVQPSVRIVKICDLWDICHSLMGLLQDGDTDGDIIGGFEVFSLVISQIFFMNIEEKLSVEGTEVTGDEGILSIGIICDDSLGKGSRVSCPSQSSDEIGVHEVQSFLLKPGIVQFEHLSSHQLIITVHYHENIIGLAVVAGSESQIVHRSHLLLISYYFVSILRKRVLSEQKIEDQHARAVIRCIIYHHYVKVGVILHHNRSNVSEVSIMLSVIVCGNDDAEGKLFVLTYRIFFLVVAVLFLGYLV